MFVLRGLLLLKAALAAYPNSVSRELTMQRSRPRQSTGEITLEATMQTHPSFNSPRSARITTT